MQEIRQPEAIDRGQFELVYRRYGTLVWRRARKILADDQLAWDVCQEVFIRLLRTGRTWDTPSPVGWLFRATTCLGLFNTVCSSTLVRVSLPDGAARLVAVATEAYPLAVSPDSLRVAIASPWGIYVQVL
jgi:hypothetical protein